MGRKNYQDWIWHKNTGNYLTINSQFFHNFKIELIIEALRWAGKIYQDWIWHKNMGNYLTINSQFFHNFKIELLIIEALRWAGKFIKIGFGIKIRAII